MVKAELSYNPYTLETDIKFNGQPPRINSLVEKYQSSNLQDWVKNLPQIFYDEMNGFDFELEFSGTAKDYSELERAFKQANVSADQVRLFHKSELEERDVKLERIDELLNWLKDNSNRNYDNASFRTKNISLLDDAYPFIAIQGEQTEVPDINWVDASIETISDVRELDGTDLNNMPIVIAVDQGNITKLQQIIKYLMKRSDTKVQQLFFIIEGSLDSNTVIRTIKDLGIKTPNIIQSFDDEKFKNYFEIYPETEFIHETIKALMKEADRVEALLIKEREQSEKSNSELDERINTINAEVNLAQEALEELQTKINIDKPSAFTKEKNELLYRVSIWRSKKTRVTDFEEARKLAEELQQEASENVETFAEKVAESISELKMSIDDRLLATYVSSGCDDGFVFDKISLIPPNTPDVPDFIMELLNMSVAEKVRKTGLGLFYIPTDNLDDDYEIISAYYIQKWRNRVYSIVEVIAENLMEESFQALIEYADVATKKYHEHLINNINKMEQEKAELSQLLSSEEKLLQQDSVWLSDLRQKIKSIARG